MRKAIFLIHYGKLLIRPYEFVMQTLLIHVFSTSTMSGSTQCITFVDSPSLLDKPPNIMQPDIDYSIAYFDGVDQVDVVWRNQQNKIQFCGSAAYGLSYHLVHTYELPHLLIRSGNLTLHAEYDSDVSLYIPAKEISLVSAQLFDYGQLYYHSESGIYFLEVEDKATLQQMSWSEEDLFTLPLDDPHGLCLFYWHSSTQTGYVRYFTPWHGRFEDSVTGSIQSYLTSHIAKIYGFKSQTWIQLSQNGGQLKSLFMKGKVRLRGHCHYSQATIT